MKAVIFDLNGVFLKSEFLSDRMQKSYGVKTEDFLPALKEIMGKARMPGVDDSYALWKPYLTEWGVEITQKEFFQFWFSGESLAQELVDYASQLRENDLEVFILSNNFRERTEFYREHFPELFEAVNNAYFSWETGFVKPDEEAFRNILEKNDLNPEDCVYFDDSSSNVATANLLGIHAQKYEGLEKTKATIEALLQ
ncbi:HAD-IA family hydrolase [Candidatus Woesearchaeota archaeon]|nr:HAD-IA family hydrolase [Candidatus Woesearchaeota archaeon]